MIITALRETVFYILALVDYIFWGTCYSNSQYFKNNQWARVQIYSLSLIFKMWEKKTYRSPTFQQDMIDNLRNVAIPGTGIPLSFFATNYWLCLFFVLVINPVVCLLGAINKARYMKVPFQERLAVISRLYIDHLLCPRDWFSFWRLNCRLASYHSLVTQSSHYRMEDKWTFLFEGNQRGVPVSPFLSDLRHLVVKDKNVEGGLGIHFYENAVHGGDWILQEKLENADWLCELLPSHAPLSTMRVITSSTWFLQSQHEKGRGEGEGEGGVRCITALSAVLRLGRAHASTDHSSVLFDVDVSSGLVGSGLTNAQWYRLGLGQIASCPWLPPDVRAQYPSPGPADAISSHSLEVHPDRPDVVITGQRVPDMQRVVEIVTT